MKQLGDFCWEADENRKIHSYMHRFATHVSQAVGRDLTSWQELYKWSVAELGPFWEQLARFTETKWTHRDGPVLLASPGKMRGTRWFPQSKLSYAENCLEGADDQVVIKTFNESGVQRSFTRRQLRDDTHRLANFLRSEGIKPGDRCAAILVNGYPAVVTLLACSAIGATFVSCSPDFGVEAISERLNQVEPSVLIFELDYRYGGKDFDCRRKLEACLQELPSIRTVVTHSVLERTVSEGVSWFKALESGGLKSTGFEPRAFSDPLYILFSSGTTGVPKCMVHTTGGSLLQHKKELMLHCDLRPGEQLLFFTTCGWMMWNWMVSALAARACIVLYDGSPAHPKVLGLWEACGKSGAQFLGLSPKYLSACKEQAKSPSELSPLDSLRGILSTGAPLLPEHYAYVYERVKADVHLASISGGTDIVSCFMLGNPLLPVHSGEIQAPGLGMAVEAWDEAGNPVTQEKGELVCTEPFVSMPREFLHDETGERYQAAYFERYPGKDVWCHGDFIELTSRGSIRIFGRSDATLNPQGVRIGTAEIYRRVETLSWVEDSLAVGFPEGGDEVVVLFVQKQGPLSEAEVNEVRAMLREQLSPRHVPRHIFAISAIPYTRSGKKVELAVARILRGEKVENTSAIVNPECLKEFQNCSLVRDAES